jgi:hypothetical protein
MLILILVPVKFTNFDFGSWAFLSFSQKNDVSPESNMTSATSLNPCHVIVFFADISNEGLNGFKFYRSKLDGFFLHGPKSKLG